MTEAQEKLLQQAKMDWLDQVLLERNVPMWVLDYLKEDNFPHIMEATIWLERNGYTVLAEGPSRVRLIKDGEVISTFVFQG